uniref:glycosyltransferase n=1 Tax=Flavobacterium sp. TaxID=239 RepID=UPI00404923A8
MNSKLYKSRLSIPLESCYRLNDFNSYIKKGSLIEKSYETCLLILTYNNIESLEKILQGIINSPIDIIVVDNNSVDDSFNMLKVNYGKRINIICLNKNLGGAGGYAVGQEWVLERGYKYCIITEDDALSFDEDLIAEMLINKSDKRIVQCRYDGLPGQLFTLHYTLYPCSIFEYAGIINANLFFRYDDFEYGLRLQKHATVHGFEAICIDKKYFHPFLKNGFGVFSSYFVVRNCLIIYSSIGKPIHSYTRLFINLVFSIYSYLNGSGIKLLHLILLSVNHFFFFKNSSNEDVYNKFKDIKIKPNFNIDLIEVSFKDFNFRFSDYTILTSLNNYLNLKMLNVLSNFRIENVVLGKFSTPISVFSAFAKKTVFIESINLTSQTLEYWEYINTNRTINLIKLLVSILLSLLILATLFPFLLLFSLYYYLVGRGYYPRPLENKLFKRSWESIVMKL